METQLHFLHAPLRSVTMLGPQKHHILGTTRKNGGKQAVGCQTWDCFQLCLLPFMPEHRWCQSLAIAKWDKTWLGGFGAKMLI